MIAAKVLFEYFDNHPGDFSKEFFALLWRETFIHHKFLLDPILETKMENLIGDLPEQAMPVCADIIRGVINDIKYDYDRKDVQKVEKFIKMLFSESGIKYTISEISEDKLKMRYMETLIQQAI